MGNIDAVQALALLTFVEDRRAEFIKHVADTIGVDHGEPEALECMASIVSGLELIIESEVDE